MSAGRLHRLHRERDSAHKRVDYCRAELARFESYATSSEIDTLRMCRLKRDLRISEMDAAHAALQLEDELTVECLLPLLSRARSRRSSRRA